MSCLASSHAPTSRAAGDAVDRSRLRPGARRYAPRGRRRGVHDRIRCDGSRCERPRRRPEFCGRGRWRRVPQRREGGSLRGRPVGERRGRSVSHRMRRGRPRHVRRGWQLRRRVHGSGQLHGAHRVSCRHSVHGDLHRRGRVHVVDRLHRRQLVRHQLHRRGRVHGTDLVQRERVQSRVPGSGHLHGTHCVRCAVV